MWLLYLKLRNIPAAKATPCIPLITQSLLRKYSIGRNRNYFFPSQLMKPAAHFDSLEALLRGHPLERFLIVVGEDEDLVEFGQTERLGDQGLGIDEMDNYK